MEENTINLKIGEKFTSYEEVKAFIEFFQTSAYCQLHCYDSKRLSCPSLLKKCPNRIRNAKKTLQYYFLEYRCIHGGKYKFKGNNKRKSR